MVIMNVYYVPVVLLLVQVIGGTVINTLAQQSFIAGISMDK